LKSDRFAFYALTCHFFQFYAFGFVNHCFDKEYRNKS
jgi:hypothetical protein